jgi:signal transduction histidine kinase
MFIQVTRGLTSMRERAASIGAKLEIQSAAGLGTALRVRLPHPV